ERAEEAAADVRGAREQRRDVDEDADDGELAEQGSEHGGRERAPGEEGRVHLGRRQGRVREVVRAEGGQGELAQGPRGGHGSARAAPEGGGEGGRGVGDRRLEVRERARAG